MRAICSQAAAGLLPEDMTLATSESGHRLDRRGDKCRLEPSPGKAANHLPVGDRGKR